MSICPICGNEVKTFPLLLHNVWVWCIRCKHCKKEWHVDDSDGKGEERWEMVYKVAKEKAK